MQLLNSTSRISKVALKLSAERHVPIQDDIKKSTQDPRPKLETNSNENLLCFGADRKYYQYKLRIEQECDQNASPNSIMQLIQSETTFPKQKNWTKGQTTVQNLRVCCWSQSKSQSMLSICWARECLQRIFAATSRAIISANAPVWLL